jgi:transposase
MPRLSGPISTRPGQKRGPADQALGKSQGGWSTKIHLRADGNGKPLTLLLTPGQQHESTEFVPLLDHGAVKRRGPGRPKLRPRRVVADKGYSSRKNRAAARQRRMRYTIPHKINDLRRGPFDRAVYRQRNRIERLVNRFKHCRRLATRYEKCGENYRAMWTIAAILLWL